MNDEQLIALNYRPMPGFIASMKVRPIRIWFGQPPGSAGDPQQQWLLDVYNYDEMAHTTVLLRVITGFSPPLNQDKT